MPTLTLTFEVPTSADADYIEAMIERVVPKYVPATLERVA